MPSSNPLEQRVAARLQELRAGGLLRALRAPRGVDLCSNDYLNLSTHPRLRDAMAAAVCAEGCGSTGSRLLRGERESFRRIEERFAAFKGAERALYFSSGYLANFGVLTAMAQPGDVIYSDERNHASLIDGMRLSGAHRRIFAHNDASTLGAMMGAENEAGQKFVVTESLFSMDGDVAPVAEYAELCRRYGATLIADEAHAVGVFGPSGAGLAPEAMLTVNTAGKALGVSGAFVAGPEWAIEYLVQRARPFIFSTAAPPAVAAALDAALTVVEEEPWRRSRVLERAAYLRRRLASVGIRVPDGSSQIIPVVLGGNERAMRVAESLQDRGFDARAIRPPSVPEGTARLRLSLNAGLTEDTLDQFTDALSAAMKETAACCNSV